MRPLPFVWPYALPFWLVYVWAFAPEFAFLPKARVTEQDRGSMRLILTAQPVALLLAFVAAFYIPPLPYRIPVFWIGVTMLLGGSLLRRHCFRILGDHFTFAVTVEKDQRVIDRGAYRWVRHPSYTGGMLMFTGIGVALGNWVSIILLAAITIAGYSYRVMVEERALLATIGEPYRLYMTRRKRFIPFVI